jgi:TolA-binding protein
VTFSDLFLSANSGPVWGFAGVALTALGSTIMGRRTSLASTSSAALDAVNVAHKQLVDGLFQQVKILTEQVETLRVHTIECEERHREAMHRIANLEKGHVPTQVHPSGLD